MKKWIDSAVFTLSLACISVISIPYGFAYEGACPALPAPTGATVTVSTEEALVNEVNSAASGTTILIADGTYHLGQSGYYLWIDTPNVTLRSESGDREAVVLDDNYSGSETITVAASNVTIADLTIMRSGTHPIHVVSTDAGDTLNTLIYNVHIIDPGQQAIKINPHDAKVNFPDDGIVACSTIELTASGRTEVWNINGSCYTGGVDGHQSRGWVIRDNTIEGFWCDDGLSEHGVHFWTGSRDTLVERNTFINNARAIGFGLRETGSGRTYSDDPCPGAVGLVGHYGGTIRNNFIFADDADLFSSSYGVDGGIAFAQSCGALAVHNTIAFLDTPFAAIEWRFDNTDVDIVNNLTTHNLMDRGGSFESSGNLSNQPLSLFLDGAGGDLHLGSSAGAAIDQGVAVSSGICDDDADGQTRPMGSARDIGADEFNDGSANTTPTAGNQSVSVEENSTDNSIVLSGNDADGDPLTFTVTVMPDNGTLTGTAPQLYYTPDSGYSGSDSIAFHVSDGTADSSEATVSITVTASDPGSDNQGDEENGDSGGGGGGCFIGNVLN
jgi:hypothetical protein